MFMSTTVTSPGVVASSSDPDHHRRARQCAEMLGEGARPLIPASSRLATITTSTPSQLCFRCCESRATVTSSAQGYRCMDAVVSAITRPERSK